MTLNYLFLPDNPCLAKDNNYSNDNFGTKFTTSKITLKKVKAKPENQ